nr:MAG TPA: hypothetical protein [Caudoviricetes sp.]
MTVRNDFAKPPLDFRVSTPVYLKGGGGVRIYTPPTASPASSYFLRGHIWGNKEPINSG